MSAVADQTPAAPAAEPTSDDLFDAAYAELTTRLDGPAAATPTPDPAPASDPAARDEPADTDTDTDTSPERDASGRFVPKEGEADPASPAEAAQPDPAPARPARKAPETLDEALRELAAVRGNVDNAAQQAAARAAAETEARVRAEEKAASKQAGREEFRAAMQERIDSGELSFDQASALYNKQQQSWAAADQREQQQERERQQGREKASLFLDRVENIGERRLLGLYHDGSALLAQDTGATQEQVRDFYAPPEVREMFKRASFQADAAEKLPGANAEALNDHMRVVAHALQREVAILREHKAALAARDKEIARLNRELNREEADSGALRPETPARGGGPRRKDPTTLDEAHAELTRRLQANPQLVRS